MHDGVQDDVDEQHSEADHDLCVARKAAGIQHRKQILRYEVGSGTVLVEVGVGDPAAGRVQSLGVDQPAGRAMAPRPAPPQNETDDAHQQEAARSGSFTGACTTTAATAAGADPLAFGLGLDDRQTLPGAFEADLTSKRIRAVDLETRIADALAVARSAGRSLRAELVRAFPSFCWRVTKYRS